MRAFISFLLTVFCSASVGMAVTVDEAVVGDFDRQIFTLDLGLNNVQGQQGAGAAPGMNDYDGFRVFVPGGLKISSMHLTYYEVEPLPGTYYLAQRTNLAACTGGGLRCADLAYGGDYGLGVSTNIIPLEDVTREIFADQVPLARGTYFFTNNALSYTSGGGGTWRFRYSIETEPTTIVPLPSPGVLLAGGLIGFGLLRVLRERTGARFARTDRLGARIGSGMARHARSPLKRACG